MSSRRTVLATAAAFALLLLAAPTPLAALAELRAPSAATDPTGPLVAALALAAWALAGWVLLTALLVLAGRLPGLTGRAGAALARRAAPTALRRAVEVALGVTVAVGALGASPAAASGPAAAPPAAAQAATAASLDWSAPASPAQPDLDWPTAQAPTTAPAAVTPVAAPDPAVVVRPGDTLWGLAEQSLRDAGTAAPTDAQVAASWPAWWSANRDAVGDDPDLLQPGTRLSPPDGAAPTSS